MVLSPMLNVMALNLAVLPAATTGAATSRVAFGVMGAVSAVPAGFAARVVAFWNRRCGHQRRDGRVGGGDAAVDGQGARGSEPPFRYHPQVPRILDRQWRLLLLSHGRWRGREEETETDLRPDLVPGDAGECATAASSRAGHPIRTLAGLLVVRTRAGVRWHRELDRRRDARPNRLRKRLGGLSWEAWRDLPPKRLARAGAQPLVGPSGGVRRRTARATHSSWTRSTGARCR